MGIKRDDTLRTSAELSIGQIIANAKKAERRIEAELPQSAELLDVAQAVVEAARAAERESENSENFIAFQTSGASC